MSYSKNVQFVIDDVTKKQKKARLNRIQSKNDNNKKDNLEINNQKEIYNKVLNKTKKNNKDNITNNTSLYNDSFKKTNNKYDDSFITVNDYEIINMDSDFYQNANYLVLDDLKKINLVNYTLVKENCTLTKACKDLGTTLNKFKEIMKKNNYKKYEKKPTIPMEKILKANNIKPSKIYRIAKMDASKDYIHHLYSLTKDGFNEDLYFAINKKRKSSSKTNKTKSKAKQISSTTKTSFKKPTDINTDNDLLDVLTQIASLKDDLKEIVDYKKDIISLVKKGSKKEESILKDISTNKSMDIRQRITNKDFIDFSKNTLNSLKFIYKDSNSIKIKVFISHLTSNLYIANYDLSYERISNLFGELASYMGFVFEDGRDNNDFVPIKNYDGNIFNKVFIKLRGE